MKKIMFNDKYGLTQAVLEGRKTMTRRIIPFPIELDLPRSGRVTVNKIHLEHGVLMMDLSDIMGEPYVCAAPRKYQSKFEVGEVVAVAQSYGDITRNMNSDDYLSPKYNSFLAHGPHLNDEAGWNNKMFVRADLMPNSIKITNIKIERLQDITDEDCRREGIMEGEFMNTWDRFYYDHWGDVPNHITFRTPRQAFASLIDKTCGKGTWQRNPWTWNYEFELCD